MCFLGCHHQCSYDRLDERKEIEEQLKIVVAAQCRI
jgi:hypothetical protein